MKKRLLTLVGAAALLGILVPATGVVATSVSGAAFTTTNTNIDGTDHCRNGNEDINCNIYDDKDHVWLTGGPGPSALVDGTYVFAVLDPGGQGSGQDPNDGTDKNLSDVSPTTGTGAGDPWTDRVFSISGGVISYAGPHTYDSNKIRLMPYDDTPNLGGTYILAICNLADATNRDGTAVDGDGNPLPAPGVVPNDCKYDAFKVREGTGPCDVNCGGGQGVGLDVTKDAAGSYKSTWTWGITKDANKTVVSQLSGTVTWTYTIVATRTSAGDSNVEVTGTITVTNPNADDVSGVDVTDQLNDGTDPYGSACSVTGGSDATVAGTNPGPDTTTFAYTCDLGATVPTVPIYNTVTITWPDQFIFPSGDFVTGGTLPFTTGAIDFTQTKIDDCSTITDPQAPTSVLPATVCDTTTFHYDKTVSVTPNACVNYDNTATFTTNTSKTTDSDDARVTVCGPVAGGLTIGFWQNKNGQAIISGGAKTSNVCNSGTWLRQYNPFNESALSATATCAQVATYVTNVIKAASAKGAAMNAMLKAQMLATALDVYFSDPALGTNKIGAPAPLGGVKVDLTKICKMIDGSSGTATCSGTYSNATAEFGGSSSCQTVLALLGWSNTYSNAGGSTWYAQVKATQEIAKNTFDAINNKVAYTC
jgi:hypothetical protein